MKTLSSVAVILVMAAVCTFGCKKKETYHEPEPQQQQTQQAPPQPQQGGNASGDAKTSTGRSVGYETVCIEGHKYIQIEKNDIPWTNTGDACVE